MYGFQFKDGPSTSFAELVYVGRETRTENYDWNGLRRSKARQCIFQYTSAGRGSLEVGTHTYSLERGSAFVVITGTDHRYYLPKDSPSWEFIYITLAGQEALACWSFIQHDSGPVIALSQDSLAIRTLENIYAEASRKAITNGYKSVGLAAQFVVDLYQSVKYKQIAPESWPDVIVEAMQIMQNKYDEVGSIRELSAALGMTEYKLSRLFHRATGMTAVQYLTKIRIEKAMELLRYSKLNLNDIALQTGFSCDNYFNKVFRKLTGLSPGQFRSGKDIVSNVDHISFD